MYAYGYTGMRFYGAKEAPSLLLLLLRCSESCDALSHSVMQHCASLAIVHTASASLAMPAAVDVGAVIIAGHADCTALQLYRFSVRLSLVVHRSASLALLAFTTCFGYSARCSIAKVKASIRQHCLCNEYFAALSSFVIRQIVHVALHVVQIKVRKAPSGIATPAAAKCSLSCGHASEALGHLPS
jgi:hypothetical protein